MRMNPVNFLFIANIQLSIKLDSIQVFKIEIWDNIGTTASHDTLLSLYKLQP